MNYVDKDALIQAGHSITDDYLNSQCRLDDPNGSYRYQNVDYNGNFGDSGAKDAIQRLALASQGNYCCYCMRDLSHQNQRVTLEHVIPQSASVEEFGRYTALGVHPLTDAELIRTADFTGVQNIAIPPRPHTVTFENLMASCDGTFPDKNGTSQCCNHKRGNDFVYPMFYIAGVRDEITYMEDGTMQPNATCAYPDEYRQTIVHTRLNCQNLKDIRKLWHLLASENYEDLVTCVGDRNLRSKILMTVLFKKENQSEADSKILCKFMKDDYWKTFLLYHWFYNRI